MATWKLNRKYPAIVKSFDSETGNYLVQFYDQVESSVRPNQMRRMKKDEEVNHLNGETKPDDDNVTNDENVANKTTETTENKEMDVKPPITPKGR